MGFSLIWRDLPITTSADVQAGTKTEANRTAEQTSTRAAYTFGIADTLKDPNLHNININFGKAVFPDPNAPTPTPDPDPDPTPTPSEPTTIPGNRGIWVQESSKEWDGLWVPTVDATLKGLGLETEDYSLNVRTIDDANAAITKINDADSTVSNYRAKFGATYNRLQHMLANNKVTDENAVAAESRIRDTDMAKAIAEKTKADILEQASQSVLAHTMNQPNQVLELLQS